MEAPRSGPIRYRSTSTFAITARWCLAPTRRRPIASSTRKEIGARLKTAIQSLPFEQRTALVLREIEGLKYEEIAFSLGLPVGTVKSRLTRARQTLRAELGDLRC